jgi:hypothetical protein
MIKKVMMFVVLAAVCLGSLGPSDENGLFSFATARRAPQVQRPRTPINWAQRYNELAKRVESRMEEPRGYPPDLSIYLHWLDIKAVDRNEVKRLLNESLNVTTGNPEWAFKFDQLLKKAQQSGENTAWDAAFKFLRIKMNDDWQDAILNKTRPYGRPLYTKTAETAFDPEFIRDQWVRCLVNFAINNVEVNRAYGLYEGRQAVLADWSEDGLMMIPLRDFDTVCERRIDFHIEEKGEPYQNADKGLEYVEEIRKECDWWSFGKERADATKLMEEYYKDVLCFLPNDKSHKWYKELAEKYRLSEGIEHNEGFYAKLKGHVWADYGSEKKPAEGAHVIVTDPKDGTKWETDADQNGKYEIKRALLHAPKGKKGEPRCPKFRISAEYQGDRVDDTYEGPLMDPDRSAEHTKDLTIKKRPRWRVELTYTMQFSGKEQSSELMTRMLGGSYSATVKAGVEYVKTVGHEQIYESKSAELDLNDTFNQHIVLQNKDFACEGRIAWTGTNNGVVQVPVIMKLNARRKHCSFGFSPRPVDPPISYKVGINLWGDERCGGARAWSGEFQIKDPLFSADGIEAGRGHATEMPYSPGQKEIAGQDEWTSQLWGNVRSWGGREIPIEQFPPGTMARPMVLLLNLTTPSPHNNKIVSKSTLHWKATKLGK